jgi:hypothetical protein
MKPTAFISKDNLKTALIAMTILVSIDVWSFKLIPEMTIRILEAALILCFVCIVFNHSSVLKKRLIYKTNVWLFVFLPLLSAIGAAIFHDQSLGLSLLILRVVFFWLFYFVLHIFDTRPATLISLMVFVGFVWGLVTIVQQFTYPTYYFYNRQDSEETYYSIYRAGVYRFMIYGYHYGIFFLLYFFYKYLSSSNLKHLFYALFGMVAIYEYGTRQIMVASFLCMMLTVFMTNGKAQRKVVGFMAIGIVVAFFTAEYFIQQYVELAKDQWQYGEDVREVSASFFLFQYWPHWTAVVIGNGPDHELSSYGAEMGLYRKMHVYRVDVGIIGALNTYGILHVLNIIWVNLKSLRKRYYSRSTNHLLLVVLCTIFMLIFSEFYVSKVGIPFYCLLFYLIDKSSQAKNEEQAKPVAESEMYALQNAYA